MSASLDEQEAALVRELAGRERRSESSMLRLLVCESLDRRSAGGDGGWTAAARQAPAKEQHALSGPSRTVQVEAPAPVPLAGRHAYVPGGPNARCDARVAGEVCGMQRMAAVHG